MNLNKIFCYDAETDCVSTLLLSYKEEKFSHYLNVHGKFYKLYKEEIISNDTCLDNIDPFFKLVFFKSKNKCFAFRKKAIKARINWEREEIARHTLQISMYNNWLKKNMKEETK